MAGKITPEDAFRLLKPLGNKQRAYTTKPDQAFEDPESSISEKSPPYPRWAKYTILAIAAVLASAFGLLLVTGSYLLYTTKEQAPPPPPPPPLKTFSKEQTHSHIQETLTRFLKAENNQQRSQYILNPDQERDALHDYYNQRHQLDTPLWKIELIEAANIEGQQLWMVAYRDLKKQLHYCRFERSGDRFLLQWSSSYAYGQLPWEQFILRQPDSPVQMRCFLLRHDGPYPPGINPEQFHCFVIENQEGGFTSLAVMEKNADGASRLAGLPAQTRTPVNLMLHYTRLDHSRQQLSIDRLIHFQWHQKTSTDKGRPVELTH